MTDQEEIFFIITGLIILVDGIRESEEFIFPFGTEWENKFFALTDAIHQYNKTSNNKKNLFLICHSFQLYCRQYDFGVVCERKSPAFGVFPVRKTEAGLQDELLKDLAD